MPVRIYLRYLHKLFSNSSLDAVPNFEECLTILKKQLTKEPLKETTAYHENHPISYRNEKGVEDIDIERCPYCGSVHFVRFGKKRGKQRYHCNECKRTFVTTTNTIMSMSHCSAPVWKEVISDALTGNAIDFTAKRLQLSHAYVFDMRHKFLLALQDMIKTGACSA